MKQHILVGVALGLLSLILYGCGPAVYRLGPGDCLVLVEPTETQVAGSGCEVRRLYR